LASIASVTNCLEEIVHGLGVHAFAIGQVDLEAEFLEFVDTELLAQATRTVGSHLGVILF